MNVRKVGWPLDRYLRLKPRVILPQPPPANSFTYLPELLYNPLKEYHSMDSLDFKAMSPPILIAGKYLKSSYVLHK